jgi:hypothetical protein
METAMKRGKADELPFVFLKYSSDPGILTLN